ncbi:hypothetical protein AALP_AAs62910U000300 [Arabis alpina]|uniref:UBX domain-containing protein n=1 Tax=Arabis alpina TaxID=50452 RepID=A0A087FWZ4_ARAAL|nr:hypothetical protein AALP_AAs62910U000300 [Arabis alpina]
MGSTFSELSNRTGHVALPTNDQLISSFLETAVGQTVETARTFLQTTNWNIEEAINLYLMNNNYDSSLYHDYNQVAAPRSEVTSVREDSTTSGTSDVSDSQDSDTRLSSLCRPPIDLLFKGSFEDAKSVSAKKNLWLIVNVQSRTELDSQWLNRDVWSSEAVSQMVETCFILWQVYDDTIEGRKVSSYYKIESASPVVFVIDPITGLKMRMWSGVIEAHSLFEDLMNITEAGPHEHIASLTKNRTPKETFSSSNNNNQVTAPSWGEEFEEEDTYSYYEEEEEDEETCSSSNHSDPTWEPEFEEEEEEEEETCLEFPDLTEEPKSDCDRSELCNICVRFPDGRRKQRKFLKSEPIQLLWSFCYSHMEGSERKVFKLVQAIPGASKTLDYEANETFDQSGLANSMISVTWE